MKGEGMTATTTNNNRIEQFPGSIFAGQMKLEKREYFEADEAARTVPTVEF